MMFLWQLISSVGGKVFKTYSRIQLESTKIWKSMYENRMLKLYFYILQIPLKFLSFEKSDKD